MTMTESDLEAALTPPVDAEKVVMSTESSDTETKIEEGTGTDSDTNKPDKYVVDWDGPDDPLRPINWSKMKKWTNLWIVSFNTLVTPLASSMFAPGVPQLMVEFDCTNTVLAGFVVSIYILGFAFGPMVIAPMCELYGRRRIYQVCNVLFCGFTIACAYSTNMSMLMGFRFLAGFAGVAPLTIGAGTISDLIITEERGAAMAIFSLGPLLGPIIGPIAGGFVCQSLHWRWVFKIIAIASGVITLASMFLDETYASTLLGNKAAALRKEHNDPLYRSIMTSNLSPRLVFEHAITRPIRLLFMSPIVFLLSLHLSVIYGLLYLLFTTFTVLFETEYGFSTGLVGLAFLGFGVGSIIAVWAIGGTVDKVYIYYEKKNGGVGKPEFRLPLMVLCSLFCPLGLFWYGWTAEKGVHWIVPIIGTAFIAIGMLSVMLPVNNYLVDAYTRYAASAMAAATILRSLVGALLPLCGQPMFDKMGVGWGNTLLGFVALAMAPIPWVFWRYGERIRTKNPINLD